MRNVLRTTDSVLIARLEAHSFAANVLPALQALADKPRLAYEDVIDTHGRLFRSFYP